jgi:uncharacterized RDD family membrane protein YckC
MQGIRRYNEPMENAASGQIYGAEIRLTRGVISRRVLAFVTDCVIIALLWRLTLFGIGMFGLEIRPGLNCVLPPILILAYFTLSVGSEGATPGQRAFGLFVRQDGGFAPPSMAQAFVWSLLLFVSFALACIPFGLAIIDPRRRTAHDVLTGLVIIRQPIPFPS